MDIPKGRPKLGILAGVLAAVVGGIGTAIGLYSIPVPQNGTVIAEVYVRAQQRAVAASTLRADEITNTILRIEVWRGGKAVEHQDSSFGNAHKAGSPRTSHSDAGVFVEARVQTCNEFGECSVDQQWSGAVPLESFTFDPVMAAASFQGDVEGCHFDVVWHPEGDILPFEGHFENSASDIRPDNPHYSANALASGFAELSRTAKSDITMTPASGASCDPYERQAAPGYLSQGAATDATHAGFNVG